MWRPKKGAWTILEQRRLVLAIRAEAEPRDAPRGATGADAMPFKALFARADLPLINRGDAGARWIIPRRDERANATRTYERDRRAPQVPVNDRRDGFWRKVATHVPRRTPLQCRSKWHDDLDPVRFVKKTGWSDGELAALAAAVARHGPQPWTAISQEVGTGRSRADCRRRWYQMQRGGPRGSGGRRLVDPNADVDKRRAVSEPPAPAPAPAPAAPAPLPAPWTQHQTSEGRKYYHNSSTGETQWRRPAPESSRVCDRRRAAFDAGDKEWRKMY